MNLTCQRIGWQICNPYNGRQIRQWISILRSQGFPLKLKSLDNGTIQVININGEIVAENASGDIMLENITGSSVLSTVYGQISATFRQVKPDSPMMFTSFEGDISIEFPATVNAILKMKSGTGEIQTDFELVPVRKQPAVKMQGIQKQLPWRTGSPEG
jgi:DUF4097 and DUF4098 domain-containing protein YvlB